MADKGNSIRIGGISIDISVGLANLDSGLKAAKSSLGQFQRDVTALGKGIGTALSLPLAGLGAAALKAATDYDNALSTIRRGTGATGDNLKALKTNFDNVFANGDDAA